MSEPRPTAHNWGIARLRGIIGREWPLGVVLCVIAVGAAVAATAHWKWASFIIGCGVALAAVLRLILPGRSVGMLAVRTRTLDVIVTGVMAAGIIAMTLSVPPMRPR